MHNKLHILLLQLVFGNDGRHFFVGNFPLFCSHVWHVRCCRISIDHMVKNALQKGILPDRLYLLTTYHRTPKNMNRVRNAPNVSG